MVWKFSFQRKTTTYSCSRFTSRARVIGKLPVNWLDARSLQNQVSDKIFHCTFLALNQKFKCKYIYQNWFEYLQSQRLSYNFTSLVRLPSSSGIVPKNWLPSTPLKISSPHIRLISWINVKFHGFQLKPTDNN